MAIMDCLRDCIGVAALHYTDILSYGDNLMRWGFPCVTLAIACMQPSATRR